MTCSFFNLYFAPHTTINCTAASHNTLIYRCNSGVLRQHQQALWWFCDTTGRLDIVTKQERLLAVSTRPSAGLTIVANVAIAKGLALLGAPRSCELNLFFIICKGGYKSLGTRGKLSVRGPYILRTLCRNFICWMQGKFFISSGNLLLRESPFHTVSRLKSFYF